jgi:ATP-dependent Clp protease adapter protein ClpS
MEIKREESGKYEELVDTEQDVKLLSRVILYNDDWHTFDEVIEQLMKATRCSFEKAQGHAFEVHTKGQAMVFEGKMKDCLKVSSILEEIALRTKIVT